MPWRWPKTSSAESGIAGARRWSGAGIRWFLRACIPPDSRAETAMRRPRSLIDGERIRKAQLRRVEPIHGVWKPHSGAAPRRLLRDVMRPLFRPSPLAARDPQRTNRSAGEIVSFSQRPRMCRRISRLGAEGVFCWSTKRRLPWIISTRIRPVFCSQAVRSQGCGFPWAGSWH